MDVFLLMTDLEEKAKAFKINLLARDSSIAAKHTALRPLYSMKLSRNVLEKFGFKGNFGDLKSRFSENKMYKLVYENLLEVATDFGY